MTRRSSPWQAADGSQEEGGTGPRQRVGDDDPARQWVLNTDDIRLRLGAPVRALSSLPSWGWTPRFMGSAAVPAVAQGARPCGREARTSGSSSLNDAFSRPGAGVMRARPRSARVNPTARGRTRPPDRRKPERGDPARRPGCARRGHQFGLFALLHRRRAGIRDLLGRGEVSLPAPVSTFADANESTTHRGRVMQELASALNLIPVFRQADTCVLFDARPLGATLSTFAEAAPVLVDLAPPKRADVLISDGRRRLPPSDSRARTDGPLLPRVRSPRRVGDEDRSPSCPCSERSSQRYRRLFRSPPTAG